MSDDLIHQSVHGYRRGHERLASSIMLRGKDEEAVSSMSDLSGLPSRSAIAPYLTSYPLPQRSHYAFAKTWLDRDAPREGCVLTHTLFVPMSLWRTDISARSIQGLFTKPERDQLSLFERPISASSIATDPVERPVRSPKNHAVSTFVRKFFGEGRRPLVWIDAPDPDEFLLSLLDFIWPSLRAEFTSCTHALKMRSINGKPFHLVFAPSAVVSRFSDLEAANLIRQMPVESLDTRFEPLDRLIASSFLAGRASAPIQYFARSLPSDPTALLKIAVLEDLKSKGEKSAASAVAAMDVLAVLAPSELVGIQPKRDAIEYAVHRALQERTPSSLELLGAIASRLSRPPFRRLRSKRAELVRLAAAVVAADPRSGVQILTKSRLVSGPITAAVAAGLLSDTESLVVLLDELEHTRPDIVDKLLRYEPSLALQYFDARGSGSTSGSTSNNVLAWLSRTALGRQIKIARQLARSSTLAQDIRVFRAVIDRAGKESAESAITTVLSSESVIRLNPAMWEALSEISLRFPAVFLEHVANFGLQNVEIAQIWASLLPAESASVSVILDTVSFSEGVKLEALITFLTRDGVACKLSALRAAERSALLRTLLGVTSKQRSSWSKGVRIALEATEVSTFADVLPERHFQWRSAENLDRNTLTLLSTRVIAGVAHSLIRNVIDDVAAYHWLAWKPVQDLLKSMTASDIAELWRDTPYSINNDAAQRRVGERVWGFLQIICEILASRQDRTLPSVLDAAFHDFSANWSDLNTEKWVDIIRLSRAANYSRELTPLDAQGVQVALSHSYMALYPLLHSSFDRVYKATTSGGNVIIEVLYWYVDWDKGKELRRSLIRAFLHSSWPPRDLAVISSKAGILDKIVSRLVRTGNEGYLNRVIEGLEAEGNLQDLDLAKRIRARKGSREDWD